jgi:hypothetical protein
MSKAALLIAVALVVLGYRWGKRSAGVRQETARQQAAGPAVPQKRTASWLSVRVLLVIAILLLIIAIFSSLQR